MHQVLSCAVSCQIDLLLFVFISVDMAPSRFQCATPASDVDVLRNVDELFELKPPAAMSTTKKGGVVHIPHGKRLEPSSCYVNAGTMVVAPCAELFQLLVADVQEADPQWHRGGWSPQQH